MYTDRRSFVKKKFVDRKAIEANMATEDVHINKIIIYNHSLEMKSVLIKYFKLKSW